MRGELRFVRYLEKHGCYGSVVSAKHLEELGAEIRALHDEHLLADGIYTDYGGPVFNPHLPRSLPDARSIIVVATPQPMLRTTFRHDGNSYQFIVPPTYFDNAKVAWHARRLLTEAFRPKSYRLVRALLPLKLLAVRSGLAFYGKTNVTYVPKYGSFHRLTAFYSDYDSPVDNWQEKKALPLCGKCREGNLKVVGIRSHFAGAVWASRFIFSRSTTWRCFPFMPLVAPPPYFFA